MMLKKRKKNNILRMAFELLMMVAFRVVFRNRKIQPFRLIDVNAAAVVAF